MSYVTSDVYQERLFTYFNENQYFRYRAFNSAFSNQEAISMMDPNYKIVKSSINVPGLKNMSSLQNNFRTGSSIFETETHKASSCYSATLIPRKDLNLNSVDQVVSEVTVKATKAHDLVMIGGQFQSTDSTYADVKSNSSLYHSATSGSVEVNKWDDAGTSPGQIITSVINLKNLLRDNHDDIHGGYVLYLSEKAAEIFEVAKITANNEQTPNKLLNMLSNVRVVRDRLLDNITVDGTNSNVSAGATSLGAVAFMFAEEKIRAFSSLAPMPMGNLGAVAGDDFEQIVKLGARFMIGGIHSTQSGNAPIYALTNLLT